MNIIGSTDEKKVVKLYGANGMELELVGEPKVVVHEDREVKVSENDAVLAEIAKLQAELNALVAGDVPTIAEKKGDNGVKKGSKVSKGRADRWYERLGELAMYGKVPQQERDLATIMEESMELGSKWSEEELFDLLITSAKEYQSLRNSAMSATYLFQYYRGLNKKDGKHFGFIARGFLRMS